MIVGEIWGWSQAWLEGDQFDAVRLRVRGICRGRRATAALRRGTQLGERGAALGAVAFFESCQLDAQCGVLFGEMTIAPLLIVLGILLKFGWVAAAIPPLAQMAADFPEIREVDLNPLLADEHGIDFGHELGHGSGPVPARPAGDAARVAREGHASAQEAGDRRLLRGLQRGAGDAQSRAFSHFTIPEPRMPCDLPLTNTPT